MWYKYTANAHLKRSKPREEDTAAQPLLRQVDTKQTAWIFHNMWDLGSQQGSDYLSFVGKKEKASEKL